MGFRPIQVDLDLFRKGTSNDLDRSRLSITAMMYGLSLANRIWLEHYPKTPALYDSSVIYRAEKGTEIWRGIPVVLQHGCGDCEDLACWRIAELWKQGVQAMPWITWRKSEDRALSGTIYHALVRWPDGRIEDPSRALGMRHPIVRKPVFI